VKSRLLRVDVMVDIDKIRDVFLYAVRNHSIRAQHDIAVFKRRYGRRRRLFADPEGAGLDDLHKIFGRVERELDVGRNTHLPVKKREQLFHPLEKVF